MPCMHRRMIKNLSVFVLHTRPRRPSAESENRDATLPQARTGWSTTAHSYRGAPKVSEIGARPAIERGPRRTAPSTIGRELSCGCAARAYVRTILGHLNKAVQRHTPGGGAYIGA